MHNPEISVYANDFTVIVRATRIVQSDHAARWTFTGCCTSSNDCGVDFGVGGCRAITGLCEFPKQLLRLFTAQTCDGTPETIPAGCGFDRNVAIPGAAGSGS